MFYDVHHICACVTPSMHQTTIDGLNVLPWGACLGVGGTFALSWMKRVSFYV